jgi:hypothetical protein
MAMNVSQYLAKLAKLYVIEMNPVIGIKGITTNPVLLGDYAEAAVKNLIRRMVHPMQISTGAIIDHPISKFKQRDIIIWAPFPAPALFDLEGFGIIPKSSAFGVVEIKRSNYPDAVQQLTDFTSELETKKIVSEPLLINVEKDRKAGIGVICVIERKITPKLRALLDTGKVVAIFDGTDKKPMVRERDVVLLINFLHFITWRYRIQGSQNNYLQLKSKKLKVV